MESFSEAKIKSKLDKICNDIKGEISIDNAVGIVWKNISWEKEKGYS